MLLVSAYHYPDNNSLQTQASVTGRFHNFLIEDAADNTQVRVAAGLCVACIQLYEVEQVHLHWNRDIKSSVEPA